MRHYGEPPLIIKEQIDPNSKLSLNMHSIIYHPFEQTWSNSTQTPITYEKAAALFNVSVHSISFKVIEDKIKTRSWATTSLCTDKHNRKYFVLAGGIGRGQSSPTIEIYDIENNNWLALNEPSKMAVEDITYLTKARWAHAACVIPSISTSHIYLFGGWDGECQYSDVHKFRLSKRDIVRVTTTGKGPTFRGGLSATAYESSVVIFGGACCNNGPYQYYNDVYIFDAETNEWNGPLICEGTPPAPRSQHGAAIIGDYLVIIGGCDGTQLFNDVHILNLETNTWKKLTPQANSNWPMPMKGLEQSEFKVYPAAFATVVLPSQKQLLVYGFVKTTNRNNACAYIFNLDTLNWTRIDEFEIPSLQLASGCLIDENHIYIFGETDKYGKLINLVLPTM
jgi:N-acetylneuraminic acid mutarotase